MQIQAIITKWQEKTTQHSIRTELCYFLAQYVFSKFLIYSLLHQHSFSVVSRSRPYLEAENWGLDIKLCSLQILVLDLVFANL